MSSGKVHNTVTVIVSTVGTLFLLPINSQLALSYFLGGLSNIFLTPDLDQQTLNLVENILVKSKFLPVKVFGWLFVGFFMPYSLMFKHRSFFTHIPIISTIIRIFYIFIMGNAYYYLGLFLHSLFFMVEYNNLAIAFVVGLMISDAFHFIFDLKFVSYWFKE